MKKILLAFVLGAVAVKAMAALSAKDVRAARAAVLLSGLRAKTATVADKDELLERIAAIVLEGQ